MKKIDKDKILTEIKHVVLLAGGDSAEREISLKSSEAVLQGLQNLGLRVTVLEPDVNLPARLTEANADYVFNILHGGAGEDGSVQGLLESMGIAYTGSEVLGSALAMDKVRSKLVWQQLGLSTADFVSLNKDSDWQGIIDRFTRLVVKPVNEGSSMGVSVANDAKSLEQAYLEASRFGSQVMAEEFIEGDEFAVAILAGETLPAIQLGMEGIFFDFNAKYISEKTTYKCPVDLSDEKLKQINDLSLGAFEALGCKGWGRIDLMQNKAGDFFLLEINTVPGMTAHSLVPMAASHVGIDFEELLLRILTAKTG